MLARRMGDSGAASPAPIILVVALTLVFEGLLFGSSIANTSFPAASSVDFGSCGNVGGLDLIGCVISNAFNAVVNVFKVIIGAVVFFFNLVSFNVPGAPWFVRMVVGCAIGGSIIWAIAGMFRGN